MTPSFESEDTAENQADVFRKEGNELLSKGNYADACQCYDNGLLALVRAGSAGPVLQLRVALHLNASLAHLRRGNLASSVEHANGALAADPSSIKALYRRGVARSRLAENGHDKEAALAQADFEQALQLEPDNGEVRAQLQKLRAARRDLDKRQKQDFKGIFSGSTPLYSERVDGKALVVNRNTGAGERRCLMSVQDIHFSYIKSEPVLSGLNLEIREGWCVGLVGVNAAGKTTLARLMKGDHTPSRGTICHEREAQSADGSMWAFSYFTALCVLCLAFCLQAARSSETHSWRWAAMGGVVFVIGAVLNVFFRRKDSHSECFVLHVSSETSDKESLPDRKTIEAVIGEVLPRQLTAAARRQQVIDLLRAAGFQMYNQETGEPIGSPVDYVQNGLCYGQLSGGQKHLIYILRCFSRCFSQHSAVLVCDELLGGLDALRQPRVLRMLKRMQADLGTAVVYISTELHQIRIVADALAFLHEGKICEIGAAEDILDLPRHPATKDYILQFRSLPGGHKLGGKLAECYDALAGDEALEGPWLPLPQGTS